MGGSDLMSEQIMSAHKYSQSHLLDRLPVAVALEHLQSSPGHEETVCQAEGRSHNASQTANTKLSAKPCPSHA
jgi:hypothetical protein